MLSLVIGQGTWRFQTFLTITVTATWASFWARFDCFYRCVKKKKKKWLFRSIASILLYAMSSLHVMDHVLSRDYNLSGSTSSHWSSKIKEKSGARFDCLFSMQTPSLPLQNIYDGQSGIQLEKSNFQFNFVICTFSKK